MSFLLGLFPPLVFLRLTLLIYCWDLLAGTWAGGPEPPQSCQQTERRTLIFSLCYPCSEWATAAQSKKSPAAVSLNLQIRGRRLAKGKVTQSFRRGKRIAAELRWVFKWPININQPLNMPLKADPGGRQFQFRSSRLQEDGLSRSNDKITIWRQRCLIHG